MAIHRKQRKSSGPSEAKKTNKEKIVAEIGAGLIAAGAVAAKWANDLKKEVVREAKSLHTIDAKDIAKVVDTVTSTYRGVRSINAADLRKAAQELKSNWKLVQREVQKTGRASTSRAKAVGKRVLARSKKTMKKIVRKAKTGARKSH